MKNDLKIVFMGNPGFALPSLEALVKNNYQIVGVITSPDKPVGRKHILTSPPVKVLAEKNGLRVYQPKDKAELLEIMNNIQPDLAIVVAFGMIFPKAILEIPQYGFLNIHPSLLPRWRGATPIQSTILNGDIETGVTLFLMDEKVDHGVILAKQKLGNYESEIMNYEELSKKLASLGSELIIKTLPKFIDVKITPLPQDESQATYTKKFSTQDAYIEPKDLEIAQSEGGQIALEIDRKIRALNSEPGTFTLSPSKGGPQRMKILEAVLTPDGKIKLIKIQLEGKKPQTLH